MKILDHKYSNVYLYGKLLKIYKSCKNTDHLVVADRIYEMLKFFELKSENHGTFGQEYLESLSSISECLWHKFGKT